MYRNQFANYYYPKAPVAPMTPNTPMMPYMPTTPMPMPSPMPAQTPVFPAQQAYPVPQTTGGADFEIEEGTPVETDIGYTQAYLKQQIGRYVKIEFLIGTNMLIDREGTLLDVGVTYVVIREPETDDLLMCDIYSIKFVRIFY